MTARNLTEYLIIELSVNNDGTGITLGSNTTDINGHDSVYDDALYIVTRRLQTVAIPGICAIGILGNVLSALVFLSADLNKTSCCLHLASKSVSDIGFLLSLFIVWLYRLGIPVFTTNGICQITVCLAYVCGFLSVWLVLVITCENFIRVSLPRYVPTWCSIPRAKCVVLVITTCSVLIYSFSTWTTGIIYLGNKSKCSSFTEYENIVMAMTYLDSVLTLIIPLVLMVVLNVAIAVSVFKADKRRRRLFRTSVSSMQRKRSDSTSPEARVSNLLFAVSIIFMVLHTPSHAIRIKMMLLQIIYKVPPSRNDLILQRVFELMYYLNFSVYLGVYLVFGDNFRFVFKKLFFRSKLCLFCKTCCGKVSHGEVLL